MPDINASGTQSPYMVIFTYQINEKSYGIWHFQNILFSWFEIMVSIRIESICVYSLSFIPYCVEMIYKLSLCVIREE